MADTRPPDYEKYTKGVAREAQARNRRAIQSNKEAIGESRGFEALARYNAKTAGRTDPWDREYYGMESKERAYRAEENRKRSRAGKGDWTKSVELRKSKRGRRKSTR